MTISTFADDARFAPSLHVLSRRVGDELVLLHQGTEMYFGLDPVGAAMWETLSTQASLADAVRQLAERYTAPSERIRLDLDTLVVKLVDANLLELQRSADD